MIKQIKIKLLKSILNLELECSKLNFIVGINSSGKTTVLQSVLLVSQNIEKQVGLNGELVKIGDFRVARNSNSREKSISIELVHSDASKSVELNIYDSDDESESKPALKCSDKSIFNLLNYQSGRLHYLSCQRIGHADIFEKNLSTLDMVDPTGKYAIFQLLKHRQDLLENDLIKNKTPNITGTLQSQIDYWLKYIVDTTVSVEDVPGTDFVKASYSVADGKMTMPKNVGSGIGYIISVLVMCLASKKGDIIIIENPEIHLHPSAQAKVCEFLYFVAKSGRQLFIETHSDHLFNGIRAGIATDEMTAADISVNFFSLDSKGCTKNTKIEFGDKGKILNFENGLFDQFDNDLDKMLGLL